MALKPFTPNAVCPKCRGEMGRKFVSAETAAGFRARGINQYPEQGDQLFRACKACGFSSGSEAPLDAGHEGVWATTLRPFNPDALCPKCMGKMDRRYTNKFVANQAVALGSPRFVKDTDQLERVCSECEWPGWCEACVDAK